MRRLPPPARAKFSLLRSAIQQLSIRQLSMRREPMAISLLAGAVLLVLAPSGQALTLGEISVRSTLGQRLTAAVPVRLAPGEALATECVTPGQQSSDLRQVPGASVSTPQTTREGGYELQISSTAALYEPMYALDLKVQCPGSPALVRQYVLMLDLPAAVAIAESATAVAIDSESPAVTTARSVAPQTAAPRRTRAAVTRPRTPIEAGTRYGVVTGDTLSSIAARVRGRNGSLWAMADAIQAANPDAFIRNDPDLIRLGSEIQIPGIAPPVLAPPETASQPAPLIVPEPVIVAPPSTVADVPAPVDLPATPVAARSAPAAPAKAKAKAKVQIARPATAKPADPVSAAEDTANPILSALAGILFGLCISVLLWFRGRLPSRKRAPATGLPQATSAMPSPIAKPGLAVTPLVTRTTEPAFSVSYTPPADDLLAEEFDEPEAPAVVASPPVRTAVPAIGEDITSELDALFESTDTTIQKRLNSAKTVAAKTLDAKTIAAKTLDADPFAAPQLESAVDFLIGDPIGEEATLQSQTVDQPRPDADRLSQTGTVDLHALASSATKDEQQAQTLLEALTLLERDYEEELTASQVLDMSAVRAALGDDFDEPTHIRQPQPRKKFR